MMSYYILFPIVLAVATLLVALCRWLPLWRVLRAMRRNARAATRSVGELPKISIVVTSMDQAGALRRNLPYLLNQDYPQYEVVVVDVASTDETADVIKALQQEHHHLRCTFVPHSSRGLRRKKLALTLGIRAARSPWVMLTEPDCKPESRLWLRSMAASITNDADIVMGYANYDLDEYTPGAYALRAMYERARQQMRWRHAALTGRAIGADGANVLLRKVLFLEHSGFSGSLQLPFGEVELLVDGLAQKGRTAVNCCADSTVRQTLPAEEWLHSERVCHEETLNQLRRRGQWYRLRDTWGSMAVWISVLCMWAYVGLRAYQLYEQAAYDLFFLRFDIPMLALLLLLLVLPPVLYNRMLRALGENTVGLRPYVYSLLQPFRTWLRRLRRNSIRREFSKM